MALFLPETGVEGCFFVAERIREEFGSRPFDLGGEEPVRVSLSIGAAEYQAGDSDEDLLRRADQALYQAKRDGRNRTIAHGWRPD